jgi:TonB family protein
VTNFKKLSPDFPEILLKFGQGLNMNFPAHLPHVPPVSAGETDFRQRRVSLLRQLPAPALCALAVAACLSLGAQEPAPVPTPSQPAAASEPTPANAASKAEASKSGEVTEEELKQMLVGKQLFLRGGYLGDSLSFNEHGDPTGHPVAGSYTLSAVEIEKVRLSKHKVELIGDRYALHFLGALPYEDPSKAVDRVKITPKKKVLRITIDREQVVKEKKAKEASKGKDGKPAPAPAPVSGPSQTVASSETDVAAAPQPAAQSPAAPAAEPAPAEDKADQTADQAADQASVTTTTSPAHAAKVLRDAIDKVFATGLDDKIRAQMPEFWQLYYQAQAAGVDYHPKDPSVLRANAVDTQAKVVSSIAPDSNEFAQASGIAGRALYRVVIGADGKPGEIAVVRPIGFGLDENAVAAIRKATFEPAIKGGQPAAETLDLAVLFRIYSKRTSVAASEAKSADPAKPGPYTVRAQQDQAPAQPQQ